MGSDAGKYGHSRHVMSQHLAVCITLGFRMAFINLFLAFASQTTTCDSVCPQRSLTFLATVCGDCGLTVTRAGRDFNARLSRWVVKVFDSEEQPLTEFYLERAAERNLDWLAGAIYLTPHEYSDLEQPELSVYVWLPSSAFNSISNVAPTIKTASLQAALCLTVPSQGSELKYSLGAPNESNKVWRAENENPLLFECAEFYISPIQQPK